MKKIYALALAAVMAVPAFAVAPANKAVKASEAQLSTLAPMNLSVANKKAQKAPAKVVSSIDDICTVYNVTYTWALQGDDRFGGSLKPIIFRGEGPNEIIVRSMPYSDVDIVGTVDMNARTVTFLKQDIMFMPGEGEMMVFQPERWSDDGKEINSIQKLVGHIEDDGSITFDERDLWSLRISKGWYFAAYQMEWTALHFFQFNEAEWTKIGDSQFTDNVFNNGLPADYQVTSPVAVPTYKSKTKEGLYALCNPYMVGAWQQVNPQGDLGKGPGYIVFNVAEPACVPMVPLTGCGMYENVGTNEAPVWEDTFPWNDEGVKFYVEGYTIEDILDEYGAVDDAVLSTFDPATRKVELANIWFGISSSPLGSYGFVEEYEPDGETPKTWKKLSYSIVLGDEAGVNEVGVDANAPVKYFNLQGMEIANPAKGQLVIKTQGNKAQKFIVK